MKQIRRLCLFVCMTIANGTAPAEESAQRAEAAPVVPLQTPVVRSTLSQQPLTVGACVRLALARGFDLKIAHADVAFARDDLPIAQSEFDPLLSTDVGKGVTRSGQSLIDPTLPNIRNDQFDTRVDLSQRLRTSTEFNLTVGADRSRSDPALAAVNPAYGSDVVIGVRQPLLRGFGSRVTMLPVRRAEVVIDLAQHTYRERALEIIEATENAYYQLAGAREQLAVFNTDIDLAKKLLEEAEALRRAGMATHLDVDQADLALDNARLDVLNAENIVLDREDALNALIGRFELNVSIGSTVLDTPLGVAPPNEEASSALALANTPALQAADAEIKLATLNVAAAKDNLKPALSLDMALGLSGNDADRDGAFSRTFAADGSAWQVGFSFTYPLGNRADKARFRQSNTVLTRETERAAQLKQDVLVRVRAAVREINTSEESVKLAAHTVEVSERLHDAELLRYRNGVSTSRFVLQAQADLARSSLAHLQTRLNLLRARAALQRIEGSALDHYGILLPDF